MANVFISHRGADSSLARKLGKEIRAAGHRVWLDRWEIGAGDQIIEKINLGLEGAAFLIVCYSSQGMAPWMTIEWSSALAAQLNGNNIKVLPVRLSGTKGPAILEGTKYADLIQDWSTALDELLKAIGQQGHAR